MAMLVADQTLYDSLLGTTGILKDVATDVLGTFGAVLPVGMGIVVSVAVTFGAIRWFRALVHI